MPLRTRPLIAGAILVAGSALGALLLWGTPRTPPPALAQASASLGREAQATLATCREHATMVHDVRWAAACVSHAQGHSSRRADCVRQRGPQAEAECDMLLGPADDSPDCMLPHDRAARLNAALAAAEGRCVQEAMAEHGPVRTAASGWLRQ